MNTADATNPAGARAYTTPDRDLIGRLVLESRTAPTNSLLVQRLHQALMSENEPTFIAQAALYATHVARNRDIAAALTAFLYARAKSFEGPQRAEWFRAAGERLRDSILGLGQLRSLLAYYRGPAQSISSRWGYETGIGGRMQKDLKAWINQHPLENLIKGKAGTGPTTRDIFRMVHPMTSDRARNSVYRWIVRNELVTPIHPLVGALTQLQQGGELPGAGDPVWRLPFDILGPAIGDRQDAWRILAANASFKRLLKQINTFARRLVYADDPEMVEIHVARLESAERCKATGTTAYEVFRTIQALDESVPHEIRNALDTTLQNSLANITRSDEEIVVLVDTSGSMQQSLSTHRNRKSALRRCDAAALIAAAFKAVGPNVCLVPFDTQIRDIPSINQAGSIAAIARAIAGFMGGGTDIGMAMDFLNSTPTPSVPNMVVLISDMESLPCFDIQSMPFQRLRPPSTRAQEAWNRYRQRNEAARLLLLDVCPHGTDQIENQEFAVTGLSGWGPATFELISRWVENATAETAPAPVNIVDDILAFRLTPEREEE